jgi:hypothetical protein
LKSQNLFTLPTEKESEGKVFELCKNIKWYLEYSIGDAKKIYWILYAGCL